MWLGKDALLSAWPTAIRTRCGFTVVGPDEFLGSGHPDGRERLPPFLGLVRSTDAGESWRAVSLQGKADLHVLEARDDAVYAFGTDFESRETQFLTSGNGGRSWQQRSPPGPLGSLAIDPSDAQRIVAAGDTAVHISDDGGRRWRSTRTRARFLSWYEGGPLYAVDARGRARTWRCTTAPSSGRRTAGAHGGGTTPRHEATAEVVIRNWSFSVLCRSWFLILTG